MPRHAAFAIVALSILHATVFAAIPPDESPAAYAVTVKLTVPLLPGDVQTFFAVREADLVRASAPAEVVAAGDPPAIRNDRAHHLKLDIEADALSPGRGDAAARKFPRREDDARALCQRLGERAGGELPWALREATAALAQAFRGGDEKAIVRQAGVVMHLAADAALPFNTTRDPDGHDNGNLYWPVSDADSGEALHHSARARLHAGLVTRSRSRLEADARVSPDRVRATGDPLADIFETMLRARESCDLLLRIDADITASLGLTDNRTFAAGQEDYYRRAADRACWVMEARLEDAALLAAGLIAHAWTQAGSPAVAVAAAPAPAKVEPPRPAEPPAPPPAEAAAFVASKNGKAFHRGTCAHVKRMNPDNVRRFATAQEAVDAGFDPCKACKPGDK